MNAQAVFPGGFVALAAMAALVLAPGAASAAGPAASGAKPVTLEAIPGSPVKRITLSARAAERLGIQTGKVGEEPIVRRQMVGGLVISSLAAAAAQNASAGASSSPRSVFGGFAAIPTAASTSAAAGASKASDKGEAWVLVTLSQAEWERLAKDRPARLLPLLTRGQLGKEIMARPSGMPPLEDAKRSMLNAYYVVSGKDHGLELNKRMRVELQIEGSDQKQKTVPYSALYYDAKGGAWVYVAKGPLVFERQSIGIARVAGDLAVMSEGPPVGTPVVTVGAALLYGTEIFGK